MYSGNTISLKSILWKVMTFPNMSELLFEDAAMYTSECIGLIGTPLIYVDKVTEPLKIINYKTALPTDIVNIKGVRVINDLNIYDKDAYPMTYNTSTFNQSINCTDQNGCIIDLSYSITGGIIKTSYKEGYIQIAYSGLALDDEGYPLIPDNEKVKAAIEYYIRFRHLEPIWESGKITDKVFNRIETNKEWYIGAAQTSTFIANIDHVQSIMNTVNRLILDRNGHDVGFRDSNNKERIKKYH